MSSNAFGIDPQGVMVDRRTAIVGAGAAMLAMFAARADVTLDSLRATISDATSSPVPVQAALTLATFAQHIGSVFTLTNEFSPPLTATLLDARRGDNRTQEPLSAGGGENFGLLFVGPLTSATFGSRYVLTHAELDPITLWLTPIGRSTTTQDYHAIIDTRRFSSEPAPRKAG